MNSRNRSQDDDTVRDLLCLQKIDPRNPQDEERGKGIFLAEAMQFRQAISHSSAARPIGWSTFIQKEWIPMKTVIAVFTALGLVFGGTGGVALAAQSAMPGSPLYGTKLLVEDMQLAFASSDEARTGLLLQSVAERIEEIAYLSTDVDPQINEVVGRLLAEVDASLKIAAGADDAALPQMLVRVRANLETQMRALAQAQTGASENGARLMEQTMALLQERDRLCVSGLENPQAFRDRIRLQEQNQTQEQNRTRSQAETRTQDQTGTQDQTPDQDRTHGQDQTQDQGRSQSQDRTGLPEEITGGLHPGPQDTPDPQNPGAQATPNADGNGHGPSSSSTPKANGNGEGGSAP